jgi:hypothetical protein
VPHRELDRAETEPGDDRYYSRLFRAALLVCAFLLALLPVPITMLRLLPAYDLHARFLAFYAPFICLILLAYLLYVRDGLARIMFARVLRRRPPDDPYYLPRPGESLQHTVRLVQAGILAVLPVALLALSFFCLFRYYDRLRLSVALAGSMQETSAPAEEEVGLGPAEPAAPAPVEAPRRRSRRAQAVADTGKTRSPRADSFKARGAIADTAAAGPVSPLDTLPLTERVLLTSRIENIPMFTELTVLYLGIFASALLAVVLIALKEHAKIEMGLSEQQLVMGSRAPGDETRTSAALLSPPET